MAPYASSASIILEMSASPRLPLLLYAIWFWMTVLLYWSDMQSHQIPVYYPKGSPLLAVYANSGLPARKTEGDSCNRDAQKDTCRHHALFPAILPAPHLLSFYCHVPPFLTDTSIISASIYQEPPASIAIRPPNRDEQRHQHRLSGLRYYRSLGGGTAAANGKGHWNHGQDGRTS